MSEDEWYEYETVCFDVNKFLMEYEKYPCLWDKNHSKFKDRRERLLCEELLGEELGILDLKILRRKTRSVRGTYNTEIRKIKMAIVSGEEVFVPKLSWFPLADRFLRVTTDLRYEEFPLLEWNTDTLQYTKKKLLKTLPKEKGVTVVLIPKKRQKLNNGEELSTDEDITNSVQESDEVYEDYEELESVLEHEDDNENVIKLNDNIKFEALEDSDTDQVQIEESVTPEPMQIDILKKKTNDPRKSTTINKSDSSTIVNYLKSIAKANENEFMAFGRSIGVQLQSLPIELAVQLQMDIQAHITKTRLEYLKSQNSNYS